LPRTFRKRNEEFKPQYRYYYCYSNYWNWLGTLLNNILKKPPEQFGGLFCFNIKKASIMKKTYIEVSILSIIIISIIIICPPG